MRDMSNSYSDLVTEIYDMAQPVGHSVGDVKYYTAQLRGVEGPVLEAACGTGRVLIPLAQAGHEMAGADYSQAMIEACDRNCRTHGVDASLHTESMTTFVREDTFGAVIVPRGSIRNVEGRDATASTLECFRRSLVPGALLLLDLSPAHIGTDLGPLDFWERGSVVWTRQDVRVDYDPAVNCTTKLTRYEKWDDGHQVAAELQRFTMQHWSIHEFADLVAATGFVDVEITSDYTSEPPSAASRRWVYRARRP